MKTILLTLLLSCLGLCAQTPPAATEVADAASRDEVLRRAVRDAIAAAANGATPTPVNSPAVNPATTTATDTAPVATNATQGNLYAQATPPAFPAFPTPPPRRFPQRPIPSLGGTNSPAAALATNTPSRVTGGVAPIPIAQPGAPGSANPAAGSPLAPQPVPGAAPGDASVRAAKSAEQIFAAGFIDFPDMDIDQVLEFYAQLVDRTVLRPSALQNNKITLKTQTPLTRSEAIQALDSVLAMNGITMINVGEKFVKAVPFAQANTEAEAFSTKPGEQLPEADQFVTHVVQLKYAKPSELIPALTPFQKMPQGVLPIDSSQMLVIRDYAANVKRMLELIKQIDVTAPLDFESEVIPIKYALASDISSALSSLGGGTGTTVGSGGGSRGAGGSRLGASGMGASGMGASGIGTGGYGQQGALGTQGGLGGTQYGQPGGLNSSSRGSTFSDRMAQIVRKAASAGEFQVLGQTKIIADQRTNSLLVFAAKQDMDMIKKIIRQLDVVLAQVLIEAIIMEVNLDNSHSLGVSYAQNSLSQPGHYFSGIGAINNGTFLNGSSFLSSAGTNLASSIPSGFSYWANFGNDFQATLTAIANDSRINVLSRPRIQTSHGVEANIQVGQSVPMVTGTYFGGINGAASSQYQQQFVGISLDVTPLINVDGLVVMQINQNVQQLGPNYTIDGNPVPSTTQRSASATVSVKDRDTIILGGMISTSKNVSNAGVPFLKDIPGIGALFRSSSVDNQRVELIVLIRPTVLPTPEAAALVARHERDKLPGIKAAEADQARDELRRLKEAEKIKVPEDKN